MNKPFEKYACTAKNPIYENCIKREKELYQRSSDLRSEFSRDYTRIIFSLAYRRLKHKTQVFFAVENDHVCTRSEHVLLVESVAYTISNYLGLNSELTRAIAVGHDLGHAPFGHGGEKILSSLAKEHNQDRFFHERNSLHFCDDIETLEDDHHYRHNLDLTYAIRDGIICHCGEVNQKAIQKREEYIDLKEYDAPGKYNPYTYEGCVVKMSDKIAYLARDIEDALRLGILQESKVNELKIEINKITNNKFKAINNGTVVNYFIDDVCRNSDPSIGIALSDEALQVMKTIMKFNYENIYIIDRVQVHSDYVELIIKSLFNFYLKYQDKANTNNTDIMQELKRDVKTFPKILPGFIHWLNKYGKMEGIERDEFYQNKIIYDFINDQTAYVKAILDYLSGMSDPYLITMFNELISF